MTSRRSNTAQYLPTLDGWRAIAVLSVIASHDKVRHIGPVSDSFLHANGGLGVDVFFAISGLLICSRLLEEEERTGVISIKGFYLRRAFRILPPFLLCLGTFGVLGMAHVIQIGWTPWVTSLCFVQNYYLALIRSVSASWYTDHFWSLSIEEHFYLLLPAVLVLSRRKRVALLAGLTAVSLICPVFVFSHASWWRSMGSGYAGYRTEMRIHALLFPALLAVLLQNPRFRSLCERMLIYSPFPVLVVMLILFQVLPAIGLGSLVLLIVPCGFPFLILGTTLHPANLFSRALEWAPLRFLGRISYSVYLWQQLFFTGEHRALPAVGWLGYMQDRPWSLIPVLAIATTSYFVLEKPCMRLGRRLARSEAEVSGR